MRVLPASLLLPLLLSAGEGDGGNTIAVRDPAMFLGQLAAGPWGGTWAGGGEALAAALLAKLPGRPPLDREAALARLSSISWAELAGADTDRLRIACTDRGDGLWDILRSAGTVDGDSIALGGWRAGRDGQGIVIRHGADPGMAADAVPDQPGLRLRLDLARAKAPLLLRRPGQRLQVDLTADPFGTSELVAIGLPWLPLRPLPADALSRLPAGTLCAITVNVDAPALLQHLGGIPRGPRGRPVAALLQRLLADGDAPCPWQACDGDWTVAVVQAGPLPTLYLGLPEAADPVITAMLRRDGLDPAAAAEAPLLLPERWQIGPCRFSIRRLDGRWHLASDALLLAGGIPVTPPATPWPAGTLVAGCCNGPLTARTLGGFIGTTAATHPEWAPVIHALSLWLQRASPAVPSGSLGLSYAGGVLAGRGSNSMPLIMSGLLGAISLSQALDEHSCGSGHARFAELAAATAPGALPATCPCGAAGPGHWWSFPASVNSLPEQPVLVLAADCLADGWVRGRRRDGRTFLLPPARQDAFLKVAGRLRQEPPREGASGADWAAAISLYGPGLKALPDLPEVAVRQSGNFRIAQPGAGWFPFDASKLNPQIVMAYRSVAPERFMALVVENNPAESLVDPEAILDALAAANLARVPGTERLAAGETLLAGRKVPWRRYRMPQRFGKPFIRDDVVLLTAEMVYEFTFTSLEGDGAAETARDSALAAFAFLDPSQVRQPQAPVPVSSLASGQLPYRLELPGEGWLRWDEGARGTGWADLAAQRDGVWLVAGGWRIGAAATSPEALAAALFPMLEEAWPKGGFSDLQPISGAGWSGMQATLRREIDRIPFFYRLRAIRHGSLAYLLAAWQVAGRPGDAAALDLTLASWTPDSERGEPGNGLGRERVFNRLGLHAGDAGRWEDALVWFRAAFAAAPRDHVLACNLLMALNRLKRPAEALEFIGGPGAACLEQLSVAAWRAYLLSEVGKDDESAQRWRDIFAAGWTDSGDFRLWLELLWRLDRRDEALAVFATYPAAGRTRDGRLLEAELLGRAGRHADAAGALRTLAGEKADATVELRLAAALRAAGDAAGAIAACDRAAGLASDADAEVLYERGLCLLARDDSRGAREAFAKAVAADPGNNDARAQLRRLDGLLGGGGVAGLLWGDAIPPVTGMGTAPAAEPPGWCDGHDAAWLERTWTLDCATGSPARWTRTTRLRILTTRGAENAAKLEIGFDAGWQELCINRLAVISADGTVVGEVSHGDAYVLDDGDSGQGTTKKTAHLPLAGIRPGCEVVCVATWRAPACLGEMPWRRLPLWSHLPVLRSRVELHDPAGLARLVARHCRTGTGDGWQWAEAALPTTWRYEPFMAPATSWLPGVDVSSPASTWSAAGLSYLHSIESSLVDDRSVSDLAQATCSGIAGPGQATALASAVQDGLSYIAIEFGRRGRVPETAAKTLTRRFGDCKDHAVLLQRLLAATGAPAWLALTGPEALETSLPDLDQFDHMVVAVPQDGGLRILDATAKDADPSLAVPAGMADRSVLVLDPAGPRLASLGPHLPSRLHVRRSIEIGDDGSVSIGETVTLDHHLAQGLRSELRSKPVSEHRHIIQEHLGSAAGELHSATAMHIADQQRPLVLSLRYRPAVRLTVEDGRMHGTVPDAWALSYLTANRVPDRRSPFRLGYAWTYTRDLVVMPASGRNATIRDPIGPDDDAHLAWSERSAAGTLSSMVEIRAGTWPAQDYAGFVDRQEEIVRRLAVTLSVPRR